jgi:AraC-like DNA-binding protein
MDTLCPYINPEFTIHQMAHELTMNTTNINKAFKIIEGVTPSEYCKKIKPPVTPEK